MSILQIGLASLVLFVIVVLLAWALGMKGLPNAAIAVPDRDPGSAIRDLALGDVRDTARVVQLGQLDPKVDESSGVAVSRRFPEVMWTHNDGGPGRVHAVRKDGTLVATVEVAGVEAEDWEDIDLAACPEDGPGDRDCLYLGDIGDNGADREEYAVDILPEPDPATETRVDLLRRVPFRYPDGSADAEALAVDPAGRVLVITKGSDGAARLYRLSAAPDTSGAAAVRRAVLVGTLSLDVAAPRDRITGAAISPDGTRLAVRNHHAVYLLSLDRPLGAPVVCEIGLQQPQGEAIDFLNARMVILTSEQQGGRAPIVRLRCP